MRLRVHGPTLNIAQQALASGVRIDEVWLNKKDDEFRAIAEQYPKYLSEVQYALLTPPLDPRDEIEVELTDASLYRVLPPLNTVIPERLAHIQALIQWSLAAYATECSRIVDLFSEWMTRGTFVRVVSAGRALLAASLPANRLAHGGAAVWILGDRSPLPNSRLGGAVLAASATGKTQAVLDILREAQAVNHERQAEQLPPITVVGIAASNADEFQSLCTPDCFIGIQPPDQQSPLLLRALADIEELAICELLDALIVAAGVRIGINFRLGHEDLVGPNTGPHHQRS